MILALIGGVLVGELVNNGWAGFFAFVCILLCEDNTRLGNLEIAAHNESVRLRRELDSARILQMKDSQDDDEDDNFYDGVYY